MENRSYALAAGIFVLLLSLATALAVWFFGGQREATDIYLLETRRNVSGLNIQAQVRYRGIVAGKVESIEPDAQDPRIILVKISLASRYRLTRATTAKLGVQGLTGLAFVLLDDDGSSRELLEPGGAEPPRIELKPPLMDVLSAQAEVIASQVIALTARLARLADDRNAQHLATTLENLAAASEGLKQMPQLLAAMQQALSQANLARLSAILAHLEKTAGETAPLTVEMRAMVRSMNAMAQRVDSVAAEAGEQFSASAVPKFNALMQEFSANSRQLAQLLDTLESHPQALVFGKPAPPPGPGEAGFAAPTAAEK